MYPNIKFILGWLLALVGIIVASPILLIVALAIKLEDPKGPVLFKQKRVGKDKVLFNIYKFRSMYVETPDIPTHLLTDPNQFITKTGRILRKTSLDELPQLFNILKGEMSFVGPRPALWSQDDLIALRDEHQANNVRPGITGLAQVSGRDELALDVKATFDGEYVKTMSLWLDIKLLFRTVKSVFKSEGVVEGGSSTTGVKETSR